MAKSGSFFVVLLETSKPKYVLIAVILRMPFILLTWVVAVFVPQISSCMFLSIDDFLGQSEFDVVISHDFLGLHWNTQCSRDVSRFSSWAQPCCSNNIYVYTCFAKTGGETYINIYIYIFIFYMEIYIGIISIYFLRQKNSLHQHLQALRYHFNGSWITDAQRMGHSWELASRSIGLLCQGWWWSQRGCGWL